MASSLAMPDEFVLDFDAEEQAQHRPQAFAPDPAPAANGSFNTGAGPAPARPRVKAGNKIGRPHGRQQQQNGSPVPNASRAPGQDGRGTATVEPAYFDSELDALRREIARLEQQKKRTASKARPAAARQVANVQAATRRTQKAPAASSSSGADPTDVGEGSVAVSGVQQVAPSSTAARHVPGSGSAAPAQLGAKRARVMPHAQAEACRPEGAPATTAAPSASRSATAITGAEPLDELDRGASSAVTPASSEQAVAVAVGAGTARSDQLPGTKRSGGGEGTGQGSLQTGRQAKRPHVQPPSRAQQSPARKNGQQPQQSQPQRQQQRPPATGTARAAARPPQQPHAVAEPAPPSGGTGGGVGVTLGLDPGSGPASSALGAVPGLQGQQGAAPPRKRVRVSAGESAAAASNAAPGPVRDGRPAAAGGSNNSNDAGDALAGVTAAGNLAMPSRRAVRETPSPGGPAGEQDLAARSPEMDEGSEGGLDGVRCVGQVEALQTQPAPAGQDISLEAELAATAFLRCFMSQIGGNGAATGTDRAVHGQAQLLQAAQQEQRQPPGLSPDQDASRAGSQPEAAHGQPLWPQPQQDSTPQVAGAHSGAGAVDQQHQRHLAGDDSRAAVAMTTMAPLSPAGQAAAVLGSGRTGSISARRAAAERTSAAVQRLRRKSSGAAAAEPHLAAGRVAGAGTAAAAAAASTRRLVSDAPAAGEAPGEDVSPLSSLLALLEQAKAGLSALEEPSGGLLGPPDAAAAAPPHVRLNPDPAPLTTRAGADPDGGAAAGTAADGPGTAAAAYGPDSEGHGAPVLGNAGGVPGDFTPGGPQSPPLVAADTERRRLEEQPGAERLAGEAGQATAATPDSVGAVGSPVPAAPQGVELLRHDPQPMPGAAPARAKGSAHAPPWVQVHAGGWGPVAPPRNEARNEQQGRPQYPQPQLQPHQPHPPQQTSVQPQPHGQPPQGAGVGREATSEAVPGPGAGIAAPASGVAAASGAIEPGATFTTLMGMPPNAAPPMGPAPFGLHLRPPGAPPMGMPPYQLHPFPAGPQMMPPSLPLPPPPPLSVPFGLGPGAPVGMAWRPGGPPGSVPLQGGQLAVSFAEADLLARKELCLVKWRMLQEMAADIQAEWREVCVAHNRLRLLALPSPQPPAAAAGPPPPAGPSDSAAPRGAAETTEPVGTAEMRQQGAGILGAAGQTPPQPQQQQQGQEQQRQQQQHQQQGGQRQGLGQHQEQLRQLGRVQHQDMEQLQGREGRVQPVGASGNQDGGSVPAARWQPASNLAPPPSIAPLSAGPASATPGPEHLASCKAAPAPGRGAAAAPTQLDASSWQVPGGQQPLQVARAEHPSGQGGCAGEASGGRTQHYQHAQSTAVAVGHVEAVSASTVIGTSQQAVRAAPRPPGGQAVPITSTMCPPAPHRHQQQQSVVGVVSAAQDTMTGAREVPAAQPRQEPARAACFPAQPANQGTWPPVVPHVVPLAAGGATGSTQVDSGTGPLQYPWGPLDTQLSQQMAGPASVRGAQEARAASGSCGGSDIGPSRVTRITAMEPPGGVQAALAAVPSRLRTQDTAAALEAPRPLAAVNDIDGRINVRSREQDASQQALSMWTPWGTTTDADVAPSGAVWSGPGAGATGEGAGAPGPPGNADTATNRGGDSEGARQESEGTAAGASNAATPAFTGLSFKLQAPGRRVGTLRAQQGGQGAGAGAGGLAGARLPTQRTQPAVSAVAAAAIVQPRRRSPAVASASAAAGPAAAAAVASEPPLRVQPAPQVRPMRARGDGREAGGDGNPHANQQAAQPSGNGTGSAGPFTPTVAPPLPAHHAQAAPASCGPSPFSSLPQPASTSCQQQQWAPSPQTAAQQHQYHHYYHMHSNYPLHLHPDVVHWQQQPQPQPNQPQQGWQQAQAPPLGGHAPDSTTQLHSPPSAQLSSPSVLLYNKLDIILSSAGAVHRRGAAAAPGTALEVLSTKYSSPLCMFRSYSVNL